jgi:hypothetical protein
MSLKPYVSILCNCIHRILVNRLRVYNKIKEMPNIDINNQPIVIGCPIYKGNETNIKMKKKCFVMSHRI